MQGFCQFARARGRLFSWQGALICLAILCLDAHLARRFHVPLSGTVTVQSNSAKVQHIDQDASRWVPPVRASSFRLSPVLTLPPVVDARGYLSLQIKRLYDRSPPALL